MTDEELLNLIIGTNGIRYTAFQLEQGEQGTKHHQVYISYNHAKSFDFIKTVFPTAHIEITKGTPQQAHDYCTKDDSRLSEPMIWGDIPQQGQRTDMEEIYDMLNDGCSLKEIRDLYPSQYIRYGARIQQIKQELLEEQYGTIFRILNVIYLHGETGVGKTRYVMEKYGYEKVFAISNYKNPFDTYKGEDILIFEEFRSSLPIEQMLRYLDGYPIRLQARYGDKVACYTKVYIISNWELNEQYQQIQHYHPKTYDAFIRRINFEGDLESVMDYERTTNDERWWDV